MSGDERPHLHVCAIAIVTSPIFVYVRTLFGRWCVCVFLCCCSFSSSSLQKRKKNAFRDLNNINLPCAICLSVCGCMAFWFFNDFALYKWILRGSVLVGSFFFRWFFVRAFSGFLSSFMLIFLFIFFLLLLFGRAFYSFQVLFDRN